MKFHIPTNAFGGRKIEVDFHLRGIGEIRKIFLLYICIKLCPIFLTLFFLVPCVSKIQLVISLQFSILGIFLSPPKVVYSLDTQIILYSLREITKVPRTYSVLQCGLQCKPFLTCKNFIYSAPMK